MIKNNTVAHFPFQGKDSSANKKIVDYTARILRYILLVRTACAAKHSGRADLKRLDLES